jgi:hypothetical protein
MQDGVITDPTILPDTYGTEMYDGGVYGGDPIILDGGFQGEIIQEAPMMDGAPAPSLAPPRIPTSGSSSRNSTQSTSAVQQVNYEEPIQGKPRTLKAQTGSASKADRTAKESSKVYRLPATPLRDNSPRPTKRLKAKTNSSSKSNSASASSTMDSTSRLPAAPAGLRTSLTTPGTSNPTASSGTMNWEKFGLRRPETQPSDTTSAVIKKQ